MTLGFHRSILAWTRNVRKIVVASMPQQPSEYNLLWSLVFCRLIFLCQQNSRGISEEVILADLPSLKGQPLADAINRLMKKV